MKVDNKSSASIFIYSIALACSLYVIIFILFHLPIINQKKRAEQNISFNKTRIDTVNRAITSIIGNLNDNEARRLNKELVTLRNEVTTKQQALKTIIGENINSTSAIKLIKETLELQNNLEILDVSTSRESHLTLKDFGDKSAKADDSFNILKREINIVVTSDFSNTIKLIDHLSTIDGLFWKGLSYKVKQYPKATVGIQLMTVKYGA